MARKQSNTQPATVAFNRTAIVTALTASIVAVLQGYDAVVTAAGAAKGERNAMLLEGIIAARTACGKDTSAYLGIVDETLGNGVNGRSAAHVAGTVSDTLKPAVKNQNALRSALVKARKVARWYADPANKLHGADGKLLALDVLVDVADGKRDATGKKTGAATTTAAASPADIKAQVLAWVKAGSAWDVTDALAAALKQATDKVVAEIGAGVADCADELKTATGK